MATPGSALLALRRTVADPGGVAAVLATVLLVCALVTGVSTAVPVFSATGTVSTTSGDEQVTVLAVDGPAYDRLDPAASFQVSGDGLDAVVSAGLELDDDATLSYAQAEVPLSMLGTADSVPGLTDAGAFVVVDVAAFREAVDRNLATADRLLVGR